MEAELSLSGHGSSLRKGELKQENVGGGWLGGAKTSGALHRPCDLAEAMLVLSSTAELHQSSPAFSFSSERSASVSSGDDISGFDSVRDNVHTLYLSQA